MQIRGHADALYWLLLLGLLELLNSLNSSCGNGSLADLEPSKDHTVRLYRERVPKSHGRRPFWKNDRGTSGSARTVGRCGNLSDPNANRAIVYNPRRAYRISLR